MNLFSSPKSLIFPIATLPNALSPLFYSQLLGNGSDAGISILSDTISSSGCFCMVGAGRRIQPLFTLRRPGWASSSPGWVLVVLVVAVGSRVAVGCLATLAAGCRSPVMPRGLLPVSYCFRQPLPSSGGRCQPWQPLPASIGCYSRRVSEDIIFFESYI
ncbi:uncharacterized protein LOC122036135 [Zingiber officinale]|uniref:uncharacterized protein LOC122036135 n=1 Tax=Zingiber officinale TaxID=94328 RepID=UPI001C4DCDD9|nr:uncharacterized protein LOC122036135 [Zingiber officinale]